MAWRPGPPLSQGLAIPIYDERDTWTQRFISKTEDGELSLDVDAMNGLETAAGAIFVELIRQQAERPPSPDGSNWSALALGQATGRHQHHPQAMNKADTPMAQYQPFRNTYVTDPTCVPQLRNTNITDTRADHDKREASRHWHRAGRTWSRVPRFRKGETAFTHDPGHKPRQAVVDKWYRTEAGSKNSLAGRVQESRWQSCHSMQTGRAPRQPTRSRRPREPEGAGPGPASYYMPDAWGVKAICGTIPKSRMFCEPVRRLRPRTTAAFATFPSADNNHRDMLIDASTAGSTLENASIFTRDGLARPATVADTASARSRRTAGTTSTPPMDPRWGREGTDWSQRSVRSSVAVTRSARAAAARRGGTPSRTPVVGRPPTVGPASFARAERPHVTDERRHREESYGKKVVRLLTPNGDVLMTVNRRRASVWGDREYRGGGKTPAAVTGGLDAAATTSSAIAEVVVDAKRKSLRGGGDVVAGHPGGNPSSNRRTKFSCPRLQPPGSGEGPGSTLSLTTETRSSLRALGCGNPQSSGSTLLEGQPIIRLLPNDLAGSLPVYREPGRSELPAIFCATTAPMARVEANRPPRTTSGSLKRRGIVTNPDGVGLTEQDPGGGGGDRGGGGCDGGGEHEAWIRNGLGNDGDEPVWGGGRVRRRSVEEEERVASIVAEAEAVVNRSDRPNGGSGGGGGTRIPAAIPHPNIMEEHGSSTELGDRSSCDMISSAIWSDGISAAVESKGGAA